MITSHPNILITGASNGIGLALTKYFLQHTQFTVIAVARSMQTSMQNIQPDYQHRVIPLTLDLNPPESITIIRDSIAQLGKLQYLINNAGVIYPQSIEKTTDEELRIQFETNLISPYRMIRELIPFLTSPSHIVNITSMGGVQGSVKFPGLSAYSASKGALNILTECLAMELYDRNIKVNALALGAVQTAMLEKTFPGYHTDVTTTEMASYIAHFVIEGYHLCNGKIFPISTSTP